MKVKSLLLTEKERHKIPQGYHYLLEYKTELDHLLLLQVNKVLKRILKENMKHRT